VQNLSRPGEFPFRLCGAVMVSLVFLFLLDNTLIFWFDWPGLRDFLEHFGWLGSKPGKLVDEQIVVGWIQLLLFLATLVVIAVLVLRSSTRSLSTDAELYSRIAAYIVRAAFWSIFLVGLVDSIISFLRVEDFLPGIVGEHYATQLGRSIFRGTFVHFPLIITGFVTALFVRNLGFIWLALLIVAAEFLIVLTRFVFSYEQAFMGDLVRFWYAGLFLFASAYTLLHDGHVRVDVFYANFSAKGQAVTNTVGSILLGLPLCWNILIQGMSGKGSIINSPLLSFEVSQSGFGMYTKYLMAAYLIVFAVSMLVQFVGFALSNISILRGESSARVNA
jgi:TRAP-type mannitol/chloroaromatic compound transport system permease small subunit